MPRLISFLRRCQPDVVYLMYLGWTYKFQFMSTFIPTIVKMALPGSRVLTRFENVSGAGPQTNSVASRVLRKSIALLDPRGRVDYQFGTLLRDSDNIIVLSAHHEADLEARLPGVSQKCVLIPPPVNMQMSDENGGLSHVRGRQALGFSDEDFVLAYIGFVYPGKGLETLLQAFKQLLATRRNLRLAIIGGGLAKQYPDQPNYVEGLHALAVQLGVADRVVWTGDYSFDNEDASLYLRSADACVLPFDSGVKLNNSSFSSVAAHGQPIITTTGADALEPQFRHGQNVFLCPPQSTDALAGAIETVMDDAPLRRRLSEGSLQLAQQWYAWPTALDKTVALFAAPAPPANRWASRAEGAP
jgi:glycosyltransferase involved in cell wall biosynthesis